MAGAVLAAAQTAVVPAVVSAIILFSDRTLFNFSFGNEVSLDIHPGCWQHIKSIEAGQLRPASSRRKTLFIFDMAFDLMPAVIFALTQNVPVFVVGIVFTMLKDIFALITFAYFYECFPGRMAVAAI